ncbi:MAG: hypothetical protein IPM39_08660 [Chloroflexi bacterium]|nr:hypothetical protein [Chloroflexota bacterium]
MEIRHLTLTQGQADLGGVIQVSASGCLTLTDSHLTANTAINVGGGLRIDGGTAVLSRVTLDNNNASYGGGIYNNGALTLTDATVPLAEIKHILYQITLYWWQTKNYLRGFRRSVNHGLPTAVPGR